MLQRLGASVVKEILSVLRDPASRRLLIGAYLHAADVLQRTPAAARVLRRWRP